LPEFVGTTYQNGENMPNNHKKCHMATKYIYHIPEKYIYKIHIQKYSKWQYNIQISSKA
jgi:hypothetical protein